jgi:hypothetical protein
MSQGKVPRQSKMVREHVQVYLAPDERKLLDSLALATGLSRAEILRRGIRSFAAATRGTANPMLALLDDLAQHDWPEGVAEQHDELLARANRSP